MPYYDLAFSNFREIEKGKNMKKEEYDEIKKDLDNFINSIKYKINNNIPLNFVEYECVRMLLIMIKENNDEKNKK